MKLFLRSIQLSLILILICLTRLSPRAHFLEIIETCC